MRRRSCPKPEILLETISIPGELNRWELLKLKWHTFRCHACQESLARLRSTWDTYFQPDPEVASSVLRVYSRLQRDETLILKGWKLDDFRSIRPSAVRLFFRTWGFPTGIAVSLGVFTVFLSPAFRSTDTTEQLAALSEVPLTAIRTQDKGSVKVRYVKPQLVHSMEFETVSTP